MGPRPPRYASRAWQMGRRCARGPAALQRFAARTRLNRWRPSASARAAGIIGDFGRLWKRLTAESRARVVRALIAEVRVDETRGVLRIIFRDPDSPREAA
jgi:hypothetical protein